MDLAGRISGVGWGVVWPVRPHTLLSYGFDPDLSYARTSIQTATTQTITLCNFFQHTSKDQLKHIYQHSHRLWWYFWTVEYFNNRAYLYKFNTALNPFPQWSLDFTHHTWSFFLLPSYPQICIWISYHWTEWHTRGTLSQHTSTSYFMHNS